MSFFLEHSLFNEQIAVLIILGVSLILFIQDRWRYDVVSLLILLALIFIGVLPFDTVFSNFGHSAIIIVGSMFVMGRALVNSGIVDLIVGRLTFLHHRPILALGLLVLLVTGISAFVNNVGALVMVLPIAIHIAKKNKTPIALYLMPLAFASHLGGYLTLIGTPRNILISDFREDALGIPFEMFDFTKVGIFIAGFGALFLIFIAWRMIPIRNKETASDAPIRIYTTEVTVPQHSSITNYTIEQLATATNNTIKVVNLIQNNIPIHVDPTYQPQTDDILQIQGDSDALTEFVTKYNVTLHGLRATEKKFASDDEYKTIEAVVTPYATVINNTWDTIALHDRFGVNFIGLARRNFLPQHSIAETRLRSGDILMLQGRIASIKDSLKTMNCLIVSDEELALGRTHTIVSTIVIFAGAILLATLDIFPVSVIFLSAAVLMILSNLISVKQAYESIDVAVLMLLAGMISLGDAIQASGVDETIAGLLLSTTEIVSPVVILVIVLFTTAVLSDFMNTTAALVVMAPVAIMIATSIGVSIDPFLMIVAIGASSSYMTPIGHESNALVMHRGGYKFTDYIRIGLPLEIIEFAVSIPLVLYFWPL
jgi:di/tricarboxylate transporter